MKPHDPAEEIVALRAEVEQFRLLVNNLPVAIAYYEAAGFTCRYANVGYAVLFGRNEQDIVGRTFAEVIGAEAAERIRPQVEQMLQERCSASYERRLVRPDGSVQHLEVNLLPHLGPAGETVGAFVLIHDISRHRNAEQALRDSEERLAKFLHASTEGIVFHREGVVTDANPPLLALMDRTLDEVRGRPALDFVAPDQQERVRAVMTAGAELSYETAMLHRDGSRLPVEFTVRTMVHDGRPERMTIVRDLRDRLEAQSRIRFLAHHDALTGLPNRTAFLEQVQTLMLHAAEAGRALAMLFIDLDHFKRVNDSLGHLAGDALLQTVARRITGLLRQGDLVARFGGDEFLVLLSGNPGPAAVLEVADKLLAAVGAQVELGDTAISVTPSIGVALFPQDGTSPEQLIKHADTAMYHAKARGRAGCRFFEPAMAEAAMSELAMEGRLAQAIREQQFVLHFQPQVSVRDGRIAGCEALVRWHEPGRGLIGPDEFIPLAESRRLMLPIGHWVLREALRQARRWRDEGLDPGPVAVNLSSMQFLHPGFVDNVEQALAEQGTPGALLELELTERMLMDDVPQVRAALVRLKALGVRIAVDDFGTGYTSLAHLKDLPIDCLKIDRSFVQDLPSDTGAGAIAHAIIQMARALGLATIAEGVEHEAQRAWLAAHGCDLVQGYFSAPPMPSAELAAWLRARA